MTLDEAMSFPYIPKKRSKISEMIENHPNPHNLEYSNVKYRMDKGESFEQAMSYPVKKLTRHHLREFYKAHDNPNNIAYETYKFRVLRLGWDKEEAFKPLKRQNKSKNNKKKK